MSGYTQQKGKDLWYDFDNQTLYHRTPAVSAAIRAAYLPLMTPPGVNLDLPVSLLRASVVSGQHPARYRSDITRSGSGFVQLADAQMQIMRAHFLDPDDLTQAFIDFGQGILYDNRAPRDADNAVHTMDGTPDNWVGYHRWHAAIRAAMLTGADEDLWLGMARRVALAWAIQTETNPDHASPSNVPLKNARVAELASYWLNATIDELDAAFAAFPTRAPLRTGAAAMMPSAVALDDAATGQTHYSEVSRILEAAVGDGRPRHSNKGKFWTLPLDQFLAIRTIAGVQLIADPGPNRGERSGLIHALRGTEDFDENGIGRMPRDRDPVADEDIAYISRWIDEGMPA